MHQSQRNKTYKINENCLPFDLPPFLFETFVERLGYGRLHEVHVPHNQRSKRVSQVLMKTAPF